MFCFSFQFQLHLVALLCEWFSIMFTLCMKYMMVPSGVLAYNIKLGNLLLYILLYICKYVNLLMLLLVYAGNR